MSLGLKIEIDAAKLAQLDRLFDKLRDFTNARAELHDRWGILTLQWIARNFKAEGRLGRAPWKKLSPNTIIGRRGAFGISGGTGAKILQDTGKNLRDTFTARVSSQSVRVGTESPIARVHEFGRSPYRIEPRNKRFLAFPHISGTPLGKATTFPSSGRKFGKGFPIMFSRGVDHPGLPARPMLPPDEIITPILVRAGNSLLSRLLRQAGERLSGADVVITGP